MYRNTINSELDVDIYELSLVHQNLEFFLRDSYAFNNVQQQILQQSFVHHMENNPKYYTYVQQQREQKSEKGFDIERIPLIQAKLFKKELMNRETLGESMSALRDEDTLLNFYSSIWATLSAYLRLERVGNYKMIVLEDNTDQKENAWSRHVIEGMAMNFRTKYISGNNEKSYLEVYREINKSITANEEVILIGSYLSIWESVQCIKTHFDTLQVIGNSFVINIEGGECKKEYVDRAIYNKTIQKVLGLESSAIREYFTMPELNTVVAECEYHEKHLLPWIEVIARDPETKEKLPDGIEGVLSFYDGSALSFPSFIWSEQRGATYSEMCACGRKSKRIRIGH